MSANDFEKAQARLLESVGVAAESHFVQVPALPGRAHVLVSGDGPPVVLLSGLGNPGAFWAPLLGELRGFRVHAVDMPNVGLTDHAEVTSQGVRPLAVGFLEQVLDGLDLKAPAFVANSLGSLCAIWLGLDRPDRVGAVSHVGCPAFVPGSVAPLPFRLLAVWPLGQLLLKLAPPSRKEAERAATMVGEDFTRLPAVTDLMVAAQKVPGAAPAMVKTLQALSGFRGPRPTSALTAEVLGRIAQPTQLVWGARDPFGSADVGHRVAALVPGARFDLIPEGAHAPWFTHPKEVADLIASFLQGRRPSGA